MHFFRMTNISNDLDIGNTSSFFVSLFFHATNVNNLNWINYLQIKSRCNKAVVSACSRGDCVTVTELEHLQLNLAKSLQLFSALQTFGQVKREKLHDVLSLISSLKLWTSHTQGLGLSPYRLGLAVIQNCF